MDKRGGRKEGQLNMNAPYPGFRHSVEAKALFISFARYKVYYVAHGVLLINDSPLIKWTSLSGSADVPVRKCLSVRSNRNMPLFYM